MVMTELIEPGLKPAPPLPLLEGIFLSSVVLTVVNNLLR